MTEELCVVIIVMAVSFTLLSGMLSQVSGQVPTAPTIDPSTLAGGIVLISLLVIILILVSRAARSVRPTERGLVERFGKFHKFTMPGLIFLVPIMDVLIRVNITERMSPVEPQEVITKDKVVMRVDAVVFFKVNSDEESVKASEYNVNNFTQQIDLIARTSLRNIIGSMEMAEANTNRDKINMALKQSLRAQSTNWGVDIISAELKDLIPPPQIQESMNTVIVANNQKLAAIDQANAAETNADGQRRAAIKTAEGAKQAMILQAEGQKEAAITVAQGQSEAIKLVNEAQSTYFKGGAVESKIYDTMTAMFANNTKIIVPEGKATMLVLNEADAMKKTIIPIVDQTTIVEASKSGKSGTKPTG